MAILPDRDLETIQFFETHLPIWSLAPQNLGLSAGQVTNLETKTKAARDAYDAAQTARLASKTATAAFHTATGDMRSFGSDMIRLIKAFADASVNPPEVYQAAQIPEPLPPSPPEVPGMPTDITVELNLSGAITLKWKAKNAAPSSGAFFEVARLDNATGQYMAVGTGLSVRSGRFEFTDATLPFGSQQATYSITGKRANPPQTGEASGVAIRFGVGGSGAGGGMTITSPNGSTFKVAA